MKLNYLFTCFLIFYSSILLGQIKFANVIGEQKFQYGIRGNSVFKLDSSGNSIWVKDFTGYLIPSTYPNQLMGSAFDGNALYVLELQGWTWTSTSPHIYNGAVIKMDTSGNVQFIKANSVAPGNDYLEYDIYPSLTNGVWLLDVYSPGITHIGGAQFVDTNGTLGAQVDFWYTESTVMNGMFILPDSNYLVSVNNDPAGVPTNAFPALTKFDRNGSVIWRKNYNTNLSTLEQLAVMATTFDSTGNIYMICQIYNAFKGIVGIKVNSNGHVLVGKFWAGLVSIYSSTLQYKNGQLICTLNGSEIYFDTLFNNSCLSAQTVSIIESNNYLGNSRTQFYSSATFTPVNGTSFHYSTPTYSDTCAILSVNDFITNKTSLRIFPNPAENTVKLITNIKSDYKIIISDLFGKIYLQKEMEHNESELDVSSLNAGIYFVLLSNESLNISKKLIIQDR